MKILRIKGKLYRVRDNPMYDMTSGPTYTDKSFNAGSYGPKNVPPGNRTPSFDLYDYHTGKGIRFRGAICGDILINLWGAAAADKDIRELAKNPAFKKLMAAWGRPQA